MTKDKAMVTDAMVEAFVLTSSIAPGDNVDRIKAGLSAALTLERGEAEPVAVKPLRWKGPDASGEYHSLDGLWGYIIRAGNGNGFWLTEVGGYFRSVEGAQYAAQYDYETRILSTLSKRGEAEETPAPSDVYAILKRYRDLERFSWDYASQMAREIAAIEILKKWADDPDLSLTLQGTPSDCDKLQADIRTALDTIAPSPVHHVSAREIAIQMRDKHSTPTGDAYTCGAWDMAQRIIFKLEATPPPQPTELAAVSTPSPEGRL